MLLLIASSSSSSCWCWSYSGFNISIMTLLLTEIRPPKINVFNVNFLQMISKRTYTNINVLLLMGEREREKEWVRERQIAGDPGHCFSDKSKGVYRVPVPKNHCITRQSVTNASTFWHAQMTKHYGKPTTPCVSSTTTSLHLFLFVSVSLH